VSARRAALVLTFAALSGGALGACGGTSTLIDSVPKSTPDLTVPSNGAGLPAPTTSTTSTTPTTTTPTTSTGAATPSSPTTTQSTSTPQTGGTPSGGGTTTTPSTTTNNSGGTPAGGFSDFCKQNPGACGQ
jgi:hypothetical protein